MNNSCAIIAKGNPIFSRQLIYGGDGRYKIAHLNLSEPQIVIIRIGVDDFMVRAETQEFTAIINNQVEENKLVNRRPRSLTTLKLEVVAERARKMKRIKEALGSGTYNVQSQAVAKVLMKTYSEDNLK